MTSADTRIVRVSLWGIMLASVCIVGLGLVGGLIAQQLGRVEPLTLPTGNNTFVPTVQEVTISPNQAVAQIVERTHPSTLLLGPAQDAQRSVVATGLVITHDGLLATPSRVTGPLIAYDRDGRTLPLQRVGTDELFGIDYHRIADNVVVPLDMRQTESAPGTTLWAVSRNEASYQPRVVPYTLYQHDLPAPAAPVGWQRIMMGSAITEPLFAGAPLIDEEGRVAGIVLDPAAGRALPVNQLQESFARITQNRREENRWRELGLTAIPQFAVLAPNAAVSFVAAVESVAGGSAADAAGLKTGDRIVAINDTPLAWEKSVLEQMSVALPLTLKINRTGVEQTVTLTALTP
jgi:serine protease Do